MGRIQVSLPDEDLHLLRQTAARSGRSVADLVHEAIRRVWLRPTVAGPVALWDGIPAHASINHDDDDGEISRLYNRDRG